MTTSHKKDTLEAHIKYELALFQGDGLEQTIREEMTALFEWLDTVCLNDIADPEIIWDFFRKNVSQWLKP